MPGRARLRVPKPRTAAQVRIMAGRVARSRRVLGVNANVATGSLLLRFDVDDPIDLIVDGLRVAGLEVVSAVDPALEHIPTHSSGASLVRHVMGMANARLHLATGGNVDLRLVVPAIYLLLAVRNFARQRGRLRDASWYQLLYWAFDSFVKLHEEAMLQQASKGHGRLVN
jgi:hypothetical protein